MKLRSQITPQIPKEKETETEISNNSKTSLTSQEEIVFSFFFFLFLFSFSFFFFFSFFFLLFFFFFSFFFFFLKNIFSKVFRPNPRRTARPQSYAVSSDMAMPEISFALSFTEEGLSKEEVNFSLLIFSFFLSFLHYSYILFFLDSKKETCSSKKFCSSRIICHRKKFC